MRPMAALPSLMLAVFALAGCLGSDGSDEDRSGEDQAGPGASRSPGTGAGNASSAMPGAPQWPVGRSWTWRLTSTALADPVEATTVVLASDGVTYDVGAARDVDGVAVLPFHLVGLGAVDASCLCWDAHGTQVRLLRFPLEDGDRFVADLWSAPGAEVTVTAVEVLGPEGPESGFRSVATYAGGGGLFLQADYSPALGQFVRVASYFGGEQPFAEVVLLTEGDGAAGIGFRPTDLVRSTATAGDPTSLAPRPITVPEGSDLVIVSCFIPAAQGFYGAELTTSGGPLGCAGGFADHTIYTGTHGQATAGPGTVVPAVGGPGSLSFEAFAVDTTV